MADDLVDTPQKELVELLRKHLPGQDFVLVFGKPHSLKRQVASNLNHEHEIMSSLVSALQTFALRKQEVLYRDDRKY